MGLWHFCICLLVGCRGPTLLDVNASCLVFVYGFFQDCTIYFFLRSRNPLVEGVNKLYNFIFMTHLCILFMNSYNVVANK